MRELRETVNEDTVAPLSAQIEAVGLNWGKVISSELQQLSMVSGRVYFPKVPPEILFQREMREVEPGTFCMRRFTLVVIGHPLNVHKYAQ